jgi:hypothetical protein
MLLYNCGVAAVLAMAGVSGMAGVLLWPAIALHAAMAAWSVMSIDVFSASYPLNRPADDGKCPLHVDCVEKPVLLAAAFGVEDGCQESSAPMARPSSI